jgi:hypothetical protein
MTSSTCGRRGRAAGETTKRAKRSLAWLAILAASSFARGVSAQTAQTAPAGDAAAGEVSVRGVRHGAGAVDVAVGEREARGAAGTEGDPVKVVADLPGIARPSFDSGALIVWGAAPEDTRVSVDGVEIPAIFHGSALRSTINGDLVQGVTLSPGAYGAEYGRSIGGMLRVETRELPAGGVHGYVAADTLDGSAMVSAAVGERVRVAIAGRYGWLDRVLGAVGGPDVGDFFTVPGYGDYQAKAQFALRAQESLDLVVLGSADDLTRAIPNVDPAQARSETSATAYQRVYLRYRRRLDDGAEVDVVPWFGHDEADLDQRFGATPARLDQGTWRGGLRASHRSRPFSRVTLALGVDVDGSDAHVHRDGSLTIPPREGDVTVFGQPPGSDTNSDTWDATVLDVAPNAQVDLDLGPLAATAGLRFDTYLEEASRQTPRVGQTPSIGLAHVDAAVEPRFAARVRLTPRVALLAAAGLYSQPPQASDLSAVFGTPSLGPELAEHVTLGETLEVAPALSVEVVAFYKWMSDLAVRDPSPTPRLAGVLLQDGVGRAFGVQLLLRQRPWRGFYGWIAYTLSRSERRDAPDAAWRLFDDDQPHAVTVVGAKELGAWTLGVRFRYARGLPRTPVTGAAYDAKDDEFQPIFGAQNSVRLPDFWQLDVRVDRRFALGDSARLSVYVEGLNVTDRTNGEEYVYSADYSRKATIGGLPIVAVLGARVDL